MVVDEDILTKIRNLGALGHTPIQIASILKIPSRERDGFLDEFSRRDTRVYEHYCLGKNMSYYNTNVELTKAAEKGDVFAIAKLEERKREQESDDLRNELFGI